MTLQAFTAAYIEAALWSSEPEDDEWLVDELDGDTLLQMEADCASFWATHEALIAEAGTAEGAGHDLWLTRCGHGAGFWDGDWPEPAATTLTQAATKMGNVDLYRGDDRVIYARDYCEGCDCILNERDGETLCCSCENREDGA